MNLSIIIPVYNGEKYVTRCLESVTQGMTSEMEIIVVNDGSFDATKDIIEKYILANRRYNIRLITIQNSGLSIARKTGLDHAQGEYIGFLDIDDWVESNYYIDLLKKAVEEDADVVCAGCKVEYVDRTQVIQHRTDSDIFTGREGLKYLHERVAIYPFMWNKVYKKDVLKKAIFPEGMIIIEDYTVLIQVLEMSNKVCVINDTGYHYMQNENSITRSGYKPEHITVFETYKEIVARLEKEYPEIKNAVHNYVNAEYIAIIATMSKNGVYNKSMIKEMVLYIRKNLINMLRDKNCSLFMKGGAITLSINYRLFFGIYKVAGKLLGQAVD